MSFIDGLRHRLHVLVRGDGCYVWDREGRRYLDMMSAYSAVSHGHCHPQLVDALTTQAGLLAIVSRTGSRELFTPAE